jgi:NADPH-dependent curcumin reductase
VVMCGSISQYNAVEPEPGPRNLFNLTVQRGRMEGFIVLDYLDRFADAALQLGIWVAEGRIHHRVHVVDGFERTPEALNMLFTGANEGKLLVRVTEA